MQSLFSRTPSIVSINSAPARDREFIERATRPPTSPAVISQLFTRRQRPRKKQLKKRHYRKTRKH
jgi:hypothetical protein